MTEQLPTAGTGVLPALTGILDERVLVIDEKGTLVWVDDAVRDWLDGAVTDVDSVPADTLLSPEDRSYLQVFETGEPMHDVVCRLDGDGRRVRIDAAPITDRTGEISQAALVVDARPTAEAPDDPERRDTTASRDRTDSCRASDTGTVDESDIRPRRREREYDDLETELQELFERIDDAFLALNEDWEFTYLNDRAETLLQHDEAELLGENLWDVFAAAQGTTFQEQYEHAMETEESVSFEEYYPPLDEWFEVRAYPSTTGISIYFSPITERKERERELERYRTIVETVDDGIYVVDQDGYVLEANDAYASMLGYPRDELVGMHVSAIVDDEDVLRTAQRLEEELATGDRTTASIEADIETADGETLIGEATFSLMQSGDDYERVGVVRDVTERKERERELEMVARQRSVIADLGREALRTPDLDDLFAEAAGRVAETLSNDYCKVLDLDADEEELLLRAGVGWDDGYVGAATVDADRDSQAGYTLLQDAPVVVSDLSDETRFSGPDLLLDHDVTSGISVVIGSTEKPWGVLGTHDTESREFSASDAHFVQAVANILATAIERRERDQRLEQYEALVETVDDGIYAVDSDARFVLVNDGLCELTGYDREELLGSHAGMIHDEEVTSQAEAIADEIAAGERSEGRIDLDIYPKSGAAIPCETRLTTYPLDDGYGRCGVIRDVSERRARLHRLREQREQLDALNDLNALVREVSESVVQQADSDAVRSVVEDRLTASNSYTAAWVGEIDADRTSLVRATDGDDTAVSDDPPLDLTSVPDEPHPAVQAVRTGEAVVRDLATVDEPWAETARDRGNRWLAAVPFVSEAAMYGVLTVYTSRADAFRNEERRALEQLGTITAHAIRSVHRKSQLRWSEQHYRTLAENIPNGAVTLLDSDLRYRIIAGENTAELSVDPRDLRGSRPTEVDALPDEQARRLEALFREVLSGHHRSTQIEYENRVFDVQIVPIRDEDDEVIGVMSLSQDITERVEHRRELEHERERLEFLIRLIRHNLLNSLNVVDARLEMVEGRVDYEVADHLETARHRTAKMIGLIETIRALTKDDSGDEHDTEAVRLDRVLRKQVESAAVTYPDSAFETATIPSITVRADELLGEAVENLLHNAVQHNDKPEPQVTVDVTTTDETATISIADNGPGMPDALAESIFERGSRDFDDPGTGFGLHLVREIVESYGGDVAVDDNDPEGAVFRLTLDRVPDPLDDARA